jgi:hypothetical protein
MSVFGQFFLLIGLMILLYYVDKTNPMMTLYAWQIQHASTFILGIILVGYPIYKTYKQSKEDPVVLISEDKEIETLETNEETAISSN